MNVRENKCLGANSANLYSVKKELKISEHWTLKPLRTLPACKDHRVQPHDCLDSDLKDIRSHVLHAAEIWEQPNSTLMWVCYQGARMCLISALCYHKLSIV